MLKVNFYELNTIEDNKLFDDIPDDLTYPFIQPFLHKKVLNFFH